jgi:hypothetical protein
MSYIINNTSAFVNIKLTETGRQKLAQGQLNFTSFGIGDSEINYNREDLFDDYQSDASLSGQSKVLKPVDRQPNIKSFITATSNSNQNLNALTQTNITTLKAVVNNKAKERGFFSANTGNTIFTTIDTTDYVKSSGTISGGTISGGTTLVSNNFATATYSVGDYILLKIGNDTLGSQVLNGNTIPTPHLWYKIQGSGTTVSAGDTLTLDRTLPNINSTTALTEFMIYTSKEVYEGFGASTSTPYWNTNTLSFEACCDISCDDVPVWNMNNVWCENLAGMTGTSVNNTSATPNEPYQKFGSNEYLGQKLPYFEYDCLESNDIASIDICGSPGQSVIDGVKKSISILHYTNNTISNFYGEFFYVDNANDKTVKIYLPDLMYHRRSGTTENGTVMGMTFMASGTTKVLGNSDINYIDLYEDPTLVSDTPIVVGKVFPQLKTVVFSDDEIIAATSYKSNRNWTLPPLASNLVSSQNGEANGVLPTNSTMYMTYSFENDTSTGLTTTLPCQYYTKLTNNTSSSKDIQFRIGNVDLLSYMRKEEKSGYDGMGFSAKQFKVLYQITTEDDRPNSDEWKVYDFTTTGITSGASETIDPILLENQNPSSSGFLIDNNVYTGSTTFSIMNSLSMASNANTNLLQFGDEKFFYGNLDACIGATIFKTLFNISISADDFKTTANPTRLNSDPNPPDIRVTEVGIYDTAGDLVMIGKLSKPVKLSSGNTIMIEMAMDF